MPQKGPHISISPDFVVNRILRINIDDFQNWPESVREFAISIAEELFLAAYNPFVNADTVRQSVRAHYDRDSVALAHYYATAISEGITMFWSAHEAEVKFRDHLIEELRKIMPSEGILTDPASLVATETDATDLRMELPLVVVEPDTAEQVAGIVKLANELKFALIPRGGGSGMTAGPPQVRHRQHDAHAVHQQHRPRGHDRDLSERMHHPGRDQCREQGRRPLLRGSGFKAGLLHRRQRFRERGRPHGL